MPTARLVDLEERALELRRRKQAVVLHRALRSLALAMGKKARFSGYHRTFTDAAAAVAELYGLER